MLRLKNRTTPLPLDGAVALLERLLQIGRLGKGRLQLGVLVIGCLLGLLAPAGLILTGPLSRGDLPPLAIHLGLEPPLSSASWPRYWSASTRARCASATLEASALRSSTLDSRRLL